MNRKVIWSFSFVLLLAAFLLIFLQLSDDRADSVNNQNKQPKNVKSAKHIFAIHKTVEPVSKGEAGVHTDLSGLLLEFSLLSFSQKRDRAVSFYSLILERFGEEAARETIANETSVIIRELMLIKKTQLMLMDPGKAKAAIENLKPDSIYNNPALISSVALASHAETKDALNWAAGISTKLASPPVLYQTALAVAERDPSVLANWLNDTNESKQALQLIPILVAHCLKIGDEDAAGAWTQRHKTLSRKSNNDEWNGLLQSGAVAQ